MKTLAGLTMAAMLLSGAAQAGPAGDALVGHLYAGTAAEGLAEATQACYLVDQEACFAVGLITFVRAYEGLAQDFYRYGATTPAMPGAAMLFGMGMDATKAAPANPSPEPLTYTALRTVLVDFVAELDLARTSFERAGADGDYVITIDPLRVRIDFNGNGEAEAGETLAALIESVGGLDDFEAFPAPDVSAPAGKSKTKDVAPATADTTIGFDRADAMWFAGYTQIVAAPVDLLLAHDFSEFFDAYLHRVFPKSDLPMQDYSQGGMLFLDPESDTGIADIVAAIHTLNFPVADAERLAGVLGRLKAITALSRQNWELILAETDDNRELVPSPSQTSLVPGIGVTQKTVDAWMATLDSVDAVLNGELLVPHWRFKQGFDLKAYFETATRTDLVMMLTGFGALPYLKDGPIADAQSFAQANDAFGTEWLTYVFWFN